VVAEKAAAHKVHDLLARHHVPDAVAADHDELVHARLEGLVCQLRLCRDGVLRERSPPALEAARLLVLCVSKRAGDCEDAMHPILDDGAACTEDACALIRP
jgi:hypothetical protein